MHFLRTGPREIMQDMQVIGFNSLTRVQMQVVIISYPTEFSIEQLIYFNDKSTNELYNIPSISIKFLRESIRLRMIKIGRDHCNGRLK